MTGYKIRYGEYGHDCWGKPEWCGWYDYDNVVYLRYETAEKIIEDVKEQFPDRNYEIYETLIVE